MMTITYAKLTTDNFNEHSLDSFKRFQKVTQTLRNMDGKYVYVDHPFLENWDLKKCRSVAKDTMHAINTGAIAFGAFYNNRVIGFAYLGTDCFGSKKQYIELKMFHVSSEFRNNGVGKACFSLLCDEARKSGAKKLYISTHSSKESQKAYHHLGCVMAQEINQRLADLEPWDIQMEYVL